MDTRYINKSLDNKKHFIMHEKLSTNSRIFAAENFELF